MNKKIKNKKITRKMEKIKKSQKKQKIQEKIKKINKNEKMKKNWKWKKWRKNVNWLSRNRSDWRCDWAHKVDHYQVRISQFVIPRHEGKQCPPPGIERGTCWSAVGRFNHWAMYPWDLCPNLILGVLAEFSIDHQINRRNIEPLPGLTCPEQ